jgi:valyl-tRNA synthetase
MSDSKLEKTYDPAALEARLYEAWESSGCFAAGANDGDPFSIVIPPPNVTGSLHMGHALNNSLQDILCRFERMRGRDVLWQPGTDHAGIATQMVVERQLAANGEPSRRDLGREAFVDRVWQWKEESGSTITRQLRRLGASCDWSRERFTMDEGLSEAVLKVFVSLYDKGLIYKDKRLVNWDPGLLTAISDLEVVQKEVDSHLWHFDYPLSDGSGKITVATTRPETMLGDSGVAVHPDDERYRHLIGKTVRLPIVGREIPIVGDSYADPEQGSGAVKITPAHDFNDFEVGRRNDLPAINMLDMHGCIDLTDDAFDAMPEKGKWQGLDRFEARKKIVATMDDLGLLAKIDPHTHMVPYGDRSDQVIEPWLTDQWYVDAATLAKPAIAAVESGKTKFVPENWSKTYFEWMRNIQPWCISRQLWWGHQIPAWYGPDMTVFVAETEAQAQAKAQAHYGEAVELQRDPDVLDTWFSSALWPFSTLGWPQDSDPALARYYPTSVLITGFDIIFFWVARMMMMGQHFMEDIPFETVYIHALVRDEKGAKMSKSKGNVIDPLDLIDKYGADSLRFTLTAQAAMGRDVKLSEARVEGYRNFGTKLWNAARFCEMNGCFDNRTEFDPAQATTALNKWLVGEVVRAQDAVTRALEAFRFNDAAHAIYHFIWRSFCDWYVELAKPVLQSDADERDETQRAARWALTQAIKLLHPIMPFVTEEIWASLEADRGFIMQQTWPSFATALIDAEADGEIEWLIGLVTEIRSVRSEMNIPAGAKLTLDLVQADAELSARIAQQADALHRLARLETAQVVSDVAAGSIQFVYQGQTMALPLTGHIDIAAERARLQKEIDKLDKEIKKFSSKLENKEFLSKAPEHVIAENQARLAQQQEQRAKLAAGLERLN